MEKDIRIDDFDNQKQSSYNNNNDNIYKDNAGNKDNYKYKINILNNPSSAPNINNYKSTIYNDASNANLNNRESINNNYNNNYNNNVIDNIHNLVNYNVKFSKSSNNLNNNISNINLSEIMSKTNSRIEKSNNQSNNQSNNNSKINSNRNSKISNNKENNNSNSNTRCQNKNNKHALNSNILNDINSSKNNTANNSKRNSKAEKSSKAENNENYSQSNNMKGNNTSSNQTNTRSPLQDSNSNINYNISHQNLLESKGLTKEVLLSMSCFCDSSLETVWSHLTDIKLLGLLDTTSGGNNSEKFKVLKGESVSCMPWMFKYSNNYFSCIVDLKNVVNTCDYKKMLLKIEILGLPKPLNVLYCLAEYFKVSTEVNCTGIFIQTYVLKEINKAKNNRNANNSNTNQSFSSSENSNNKSVNGNNKSKSPNRSDSNYNSNNNLDSFSKEFREKNIEMISKFIKDTQKELEDTKNKEQNTKSLRLVSKNKSKNIEDLTLDDYIEEKIRNQIFMVFPKCLFLLKLLHDPVLIIESTIFNTNYLGIVNFITELNHLDKALYGMVKVEGENKGVGTVYKICSKYISFLSYNITLKKMKIDHKDFSEVEYLIQGGFPLNISKMLLTLKVMKIDDDTSYVIMTLEFLEKVSSNFVLAVKLIMRRTYIYLLKKLSTLIKYMKKIRHNKFLSEDIFEKAEYNDDNVSCCSSNNDID